MKSIGKILITINTFSISSLLCYLILYRTDNVPVTLNFLSRFDKDINTRYVYSNNTFGDRVNYGSSLRTAGEKNKKIYS